MSRAVARLRGHGRLLTSEVFVVPRDGTADLVGELERAADELHRLDWRLHGVVLVPVRHLEPHQPAKAGPGARGSGRR